MPRLSAWIVVALSLLPAWAMAEEAYWNQYRGPDGSGHFTAAKLPEAFGENDGVKWKTPIDGKAWSSPVVWGKQVWLTNANLEGTKLWAVCLDFETGQVIHNLLAFEIAKPQFCHAFNSYASPTPAIEEGRVYVHFGSPGTMCIDTATGNVLWKRQDLPCDHFRGAGSSPIIVGDLLIICFDGFDFQYVVALNKKTGETVWKKDRAFDYKTDNGDNKKAYGTPSVFKLNGREAIVCPAAVATETFDVKSGELLWTVRHEGMNGSARPLFFDGLMFITNGMGKLVVFKPQDSGEITSDKLEWTSNKAVAKRTSPLIINGLLYMVTDDGIMSCSDAVTGKAIWKERLGGEFSSSPIFVDGKIYCCSMNGDVTVVRPGEKFDLVSKNTFSDGFMATPAVLGKSLILRSTKAVYRVEK